MFAERLPGLVSPFANQTDCIAKIRAAMGHGAGGETSRRLLIRVGITVSGDTVLRPLKRRSQSRCRGRALRIVGVDEWAWRRGATCETILGDLESRAVVDVLSDPSSASLTAWLSRHLAVEIVCRDRHRLLAEGDRVGAPQAKQVADRFQASIRFAKAGTVLVIRDGLVEAGWHAEPLFADVAEAGLR